MVAMAAAVNCGQGGGAIMIASGFDSSMLHGDGHGPVSSTGVGRTPLEGIFQRFGKSLPCVERVSGFLVISDCSPTVINGVLFNGRQTMRVRFESKARGPLAELRNFVEKALNNPADLTLSNASFPAKVSGRPWVEEDGSIVLLIRSFSVTLPGADQEENSP